jgi:hypothetical protein
VTGSFEGSAHAQASDTFQRLWNKYKGQFSQARYDLLDHHHHRHHHQHLLTIIFTATVDCRVLQMLEMWLTRYPGPFVRPSAFASPGANGDVMRKTLDAFLERAATTKAASRFEQALARLRDQLGALTATAAATAPCEEPGEGLDDSAPEDFAGSDEELLTEYQALDLLKVPNNNI